MVSLQNILLNFKVALRRRLVTWPVYSQFQQKIFPEYEQLPFRALRVAWNHLQPFVKSADVYKSIELSIGIRQ
jgi:hypothetical protein